MARPPGGPGPDRCSVPAPCPPGPGLRPPTRPPTYPPDSSGTATSAPGGSGVVGEPGPAEDDVGADDPGAPPLRGRPGRRPPPRSRSGWAASPASPVPAEHPAGGLSDALPPGAPAEMGQRGPDRSPPSGRPALSRPLGAQARTEGGQPHHDPRGAEAALAASGGHHGPAQRSRSAGGQSVERGDLAAVQAPDRGDARHPGGAVHPHRAAPALALGAAPVLHRADAQPGHAGRRGGTTRRRLPRRRCRRRRAGSADQVQRLS